MSDGIESDLARCGQPHQPGLRVSSREVACQDSEAGVTAEEERSLFEPRHRCQEVRRIKRSAIGNQGVSADKALLHLVAVGQRVPDPAVSNAGHREPSGIIVRTDEVHPRLRRIQGKKVVH